MTLTTDHIQIVGWIAAGVALAAAGLLAVAVLDNDTAEQPVRRDTPSQTVAEHDSINGPIRSATPSPP